MDPDAELRALEKRREMLKEKKRLREERQRRLAEGVAEASIPKRVSPVPNTPGPSNVNDVTPTKASETSSKENTPTATEKPAVKVNAAESRSSLSPRAASPQELHDLEQQQREAERKARRAELAAERERRQKQLEADAHREQQALDRKREERRRRREERQRELASAAVVKRDMVDTTDKGANRPRSQTAVPGEAGVEAISDGRSRAETLPIGKRAKSVSFAENLVEENLYTPAASTDTSLISEAASPPRAGNDASEIDIDVLSPPRAADNDDNDDGDVTPTNTSPQVLARGWTRTSTSSGDEEPELKSTLRKKAARDDDDLDALFAEAADDIAQGKGANTLDELLHESGVEDAVRPGGVHQADARASVTEVSTQQDHVTLRHVGRPSANLEPEHEFAVPAWQQEAEQKKQQVKAKKKAKNEQLEAAVAHITDERERKQALRKLKREQMVSTLERSEQSQASTQARVRQHPIQSDADNDDKPAAVVVNRHVAKVDHSHAVRKDSKGERRLSGSTEDLFADLEGLDDDAASALLEDLEDADAVSQALRSPDKADKVIKADNNDQDSSASSKAWDATLDATTPTSTPTRTSKPTDTLTPPTNPTTTTTTPPSQVKVLIPKDGTVTSPLPSTEELIAQVHSRRAESANASAVSSRTSSVAEGPLDTSSTKDASPHSDTTPSTSSATKVDASADSSSTPPISAVSVSTSDLDLIASEARSRLDSSAARAKLKAGANRHVRPRTGTGRSAARRPGGARSGSGAANGRSTVKTLSGATTEHSSSDGVVLRNDRSGESSTDTSANARSQTMGGDMSAVRKAQNVARAARAARGVKTDSGASSMAFLLHQSGGLPAKSTLRKTGATLGVVKGSPGLKRTHRERGSTLYKLKGKRYIYPCKVGKTVGVLSDGDCYVLDAVGTLYKWVGQQANRIEKTAAEALCIDIKDNEYGGRSKVVTVNCSVTCGKDATGIEREFYQQLVEEGDDVDAVTIQPAAEDEADADRRYELDMVTSTTLLEVDESGRTTVLATGRDIIRSMLKTSGAYVLQTGPEVYFWHGRRASAALKQHASDQADHLAADAPYPPQKCVEQLEPAVFKRKFSQWDQGIELGKKELKNAPPLESQAFRVRALTSTGLIPNRPAAFENVRQLADPHAHDKPVKTYALADLKRWKQANELPDDVDWAKVERHLSEEEHVEALGVSSTRFQAYPPFKQLNLKSKAGLR
eukprot:TRINITY_DN7353_c0_g1_i2.p1 TRINITY_DN7353_c0_g1~~TRINITY_DN7353_c0_g1_i2.p1  ORF type:complete len:1221 (+),score=382.92 TRINITY_DN7353_c0_g1_i2:24-3665(+)